MGVEGRFVLIVQVLDLDLDRLLEGVIDEFVRKSRALVLGCEDEEYRGFICFCEEYLGPAFLVIDRYFARVQTSYHAGQKDQRVEPHYSLKRFHEVFAMV